MHWAGCQAPLRSISPNSGGSPEETFCYPASFSRMMPVLGCLEFFECIVHVPTDAVVDYVAHHPELFRVLAASRLACERNPPVQTACPKCSTIVKSTAQQWTIIRGSCPELIGTFWQGQPEYCPVLSVVVEPDVTLPGVANRARVQAEIDRTRAALRSS